MRTDGEGAARGSQRQRPRSSMGAQQAAASAGRDASITEDQALAAGLCGSIRCVGGAPGRQGTTGAAATSTTEIQRYRTVGKRLRAILATERRLHASIRFALVSFQMRAQPCADPAKGVAGALAYTIAY